MGLASHCQMLRQQIGEYNRLPLLGLSLLPHASWLISGKVFTGAGRREDKSFAKVRLKFDFFIPALHTQHKWCKK